MKCYDCGGPCEKRDVKMERRYAGGRPGNRRYKKQPICDLCRRLEYLDNKQPLIAAFVDNVIRQEIRRKK